MICDLLPYIVRKLGADHAFYKKELKQKYIIENHLDANTELEILQSLDNESIKSFGCICVVQHHTKIEFDLRAIYKNSKVSLIYDCQNRLEYNTESKLN